MTTLIYHEKQAAALCGRHALNNLLQVRHEHPFSSRKKKKQKKRNNAGKVFPFLDFFFVYLLLDYVYYLGYSSFPT